MSTQNVLKILFISRAYPPVVGGIEKQNFEIAKALSGITHVDIIANIRGKKFIPIFLVATFFKLLVVLPKYDVVLLGDGVLAILGYVIKKISKKRVVCILHGLDITFKNQLYQFLWLRFFLPALDKYIAVGNETIKQGVNRDLLQAKFVFIPNGVEIIENSSQFTREDLENLVKMQMPVRAPVPLQKNVILTLGRLIKRKGVVWFINEVMPKLPNDITYLIAGNGNETKLVEIAIKKHQLQNRVICLGLVTDKEKAVLLSTADLFIQPNIAIAGDMEGFGLVVLEAAAYGTVVVASDLEGLKDAIHIGKNGFLVESANAEAYVKIISDLLANKKYLEQLGHDCQEYVEDHFSWQNIANRYLEEL